MAARRGRRPHGTFRTAGSLWFTALLGCAPDWSATDARDGGMLVDLDPTRNGGAETTARSIDAGAGDAPEPPARPVPEVLDGGMLAPAPDPSADASLSNGVEATDASQASPPASEPVSAPQPPPAAVPMACPSTQERCGGACVDTQSNAAHCGDCDKPCAGTCSAGQCQSEVGCSDGSRESFLDVKRFPGIAGCAARWPLASLRAPSTGQPCGNGLQRACAVPADACASGWHVCGGSGPLELTQRVTQLQCATQRGRFAAALSDVSCEMCGRGATHGAVCCGTSCKVEGGSCLWRDKTAWFGETNAIDELNACAEISNAEDKDSIGVLCCR